MTTPKSTKQPAPAIPFPNFPLWWHAPTGRWCKKIKGKRYYFSRVGDPDPKKALAKYEADLPGILRGEQPTRGGTPLTVETLCNLYLDALKKRIGANRRGVTRVTWTNRRSSARRLVRLLGRDTLVANLRAADIDKLARKISEEEKTPRGEPLKPSTVAAEFRLIKAIFAWAYDRELIAQPVRVGGLQPPTRCDERKANGNGAGRVATYTPEELRLLVEAAKEPLKAMILLGINCAFGNHDVGALPLDALDLTDPANAWHSFARPKTGEPRLCPLWPRTVASLRRVIDNRPEPRNPGDRGLVFLTRFGKRWCGEKGESGYWGDSVLPALQKLLAALEESEGVEFEAKCRGFYTLRHSWATLTDGCGDDAARRIIMGHSAPTMIDGYSHFVERGDARNRLRRVADVVHQTEFGVGAWPDSE